MTTDQAVRYFGGISNGGQAKLADALGIRAQSVQQWGERPPIGRQYQIEVLTNGALKAERPEGSSYGC